ncbi:MAG TPA: ATP-binding protein, partial [Polyangia bacterium]|nr:ATP-binding protein [Polyangia bacterium]
GARSFLLYGKPVSGGRSIVIASDAAMFLGAVAWTPVPPGTRLFVTDPAGVIWTSCETPAGCRAYGRDKLPNDIQIGPPAARQMGPRGTMVVRPTSIPAVQVSERVDRPTGSWVVTWLASTQPIVTRQQSMVVRVVLTAMAAALAVAAIGVVILRQQRKAIELQTSQAIVDNAPLGVLGVSQDGRVVVANGFLTDRLGTVRVGLPLKDALSGPRAAPLRDLADLLMTELGAKGELRDQQLRFVTTGSQQFQVRIVPVKSHELGVRTFALVEDQSELRALEHQLVRAEKLITVGVLSAGIAHEIGSPLAVIRGRAQQVLRVVDSGARADDLRTIIKHIDNISTTIRKVLDFSRRQAIERRQIDLPAVVERARSLLQWKLEARQVELAAPLDPALPPVSADPDQLEQVLVNLILNACDASPEGSRITITARPAGSFLQIDVQDQGCGIAPEHLNSIFDPFFTTKKRGEGTGLGLTIVASVVRNHGGEIHVASTPEKGTNVSMRWPIAATALERAHA